MLFISEQKFNNSVKKNHRPWSSINLNLVPRLISSFFFLVPFVLSSNRSKRKEYYLAFSFVTFLAQKIAMRMFQKKKKASILTIYTISPVFLVSRETNQSFPLVHLVLNFVAGCGLFRLATDHCANKRQPDPYHGTIKSPTWKIKHLFSALLFIFFFLSATGGGQIK